MTLVDASVALKWVIDEEDSEAAAQLLLVEPLAAPEFLMIECANVLWARARRGALTRDEAGAALAAIEGSPVQLFPAAGYAGAAQEIAFALDQTVYDSLYLAIAVAERSVLVTADRRFATAARRHPRYAAAVRLLGA